MSFLRWSFLLATVFSLVTGCSVAVRKARDFAVSKADELAGEAALKKLEEVNPQLAVTIRTQMDDMRTKLQESGGEASNTPYMDAFKSHWGEGAATVLLLLLGKLWRTASKRKELLSIMSRAVGTTLSADGSSSILDALRHEAEAAGLVGSVRKNLAKEGVQA